VAKMQQSRNFTRGENRTAMASHTIDAQDSGRVSENRLNLMIHNANLSGVAEEVMKSQSPVDCFESNGMKKSNTGMLPGKKLSTSIGVSSVKKLADRLVVPQRYSHNPSQTPLDKLLFNLN